MSVGSGSAECGLDPDIALHCSSSHQTAAHAATQPDNSQHERERLTRTRQLAHSLSAQPRSDAEAMIGRTDERMGGRVSSRSVRVGGQGRCR